MPCAKAASRLERFPQRTVRTATAHRQTEAIGIASAAVQLAEVAHIEQDWPDVPEGPATLVMGVDGAFVPVLRGAWADGKPLVVGEVGEPVEVKGEALGETHSRSYFSRVREAQPFQRLTLGERYRRRLETAGHVAASSAGAEWIQGCVDDHGPEALRMLDVPHAAERIGQIGDVVLGANHASLAAWQTRQLHDRTHSGPTDRLAQLTSVAAEHRSDELVAENLAYLNKRRTQMHDPSFQAAGWPIGSGIAESANTLVVEARLKGAGMHWSRARVNPMRTVRNAVCNDRWDEVWQQSSAHIRRAGRIGRPVQSKPAVQAAAEAALPPPAQPATEPAPPTKAATTHPWRRFNDATKARLAQAGTNARK